MFSFTLLLSEIDDSQELLLPSIYVLHETNYDSLLNLPSHFNGCSSFSVWVKPQNTNLQQGIHREQSPAFFINSTHIGNLIIAMGVLRFMPTTACSAEIRKQFQQARIKVMPEQDVESDLLTTYQSRLLSTLENDLPEYLCHLNMIAIDEKKSHGTLKFPGELTKQASYLLFEDCSKRGIWQRIGQLGLNPYMDFARIFYFERQPNGVGLALHCLQLSYKDKLRQTIENQRVNSPNLIIAEQEREYLAGMMEDIFSRKNNKTFEQSMSEITQFCDVDNEVYLLDYSADHERICRNILWQFVTELEMPTTLRDFYEAIHDCWQERVGLLLEAKAEENLVSIPLNDTVFVLDEPVVAPEVLDDHFEEELALSRQALRDRFEQVKKEDENNELIDSLFTVPVGTASSPADRPLQEHAFSQVAGYPDLLRTHILPLLPVKDVLNFTSTCYEFRNRFNIFKNPLLLLEIVKRMNAKQLYHLLRVKEKDIRKIYDEMSKRNCDIKVIRAVQILKALVMDVSEHNKEGISFDTLIKLKEHLQNTSKRQPRQLLLTFDFMIDLLTKRLLHPFVKVPDPFGEGMFALFRPKIHNPKLYEEGGGFAPWTYQVFHDNKSVFYKNMRGLNLCLTNLEDCNWDYACFDGANLQTAYFGKNNLRHTVFQFSASLFGMMVARKHFGLKLPRVRYFTEEPDGHEVYNVLSLFQCGHTWGMSYLFIGAIQPIARQFNRKKFTDQHHPLHVAAEATQNEIQAEVAKQLIEAARRLVIVGKARQALIILCVGFQDDYFRRKRSTLKTMVGRIFAKCPGEILKEEFERIIAEEKIELTNELKCRFSDRYDMTIVDNDIHVPMHKNPFYMAN